MPTQDRKAVRTAKSAGRTASPGGARAAKGTLRDVFIGKLPGRATVDVLQIRQGFGLARPAFRRLSGLSERAVFDWETGKKNPDDATVRRLLELTRLLEALSRILKPDTIPSWLNTPNAAFSGLKPLEVIERGQVDQLWRMIYTLDSGQPA